MMNARLSKGVPANSAEVGPPTVVAGRFGCKILWPIGVPGAGNRQSAVCRSFRLGRSNTYHLNAAPIMASTAAAMTPVASSAGTTLAAVDTVTIAA